MQPNSLDRIEAELTLLVRRAQKVRLHAGAPGELMERAAYAILGVLSDVGPLRSGELAGRFLLDASTVSRQVAGLVRDGLVEREADPEDGRACRLRITPRGSDALSAVRHARRRVVLELLQEWPEEDRAAFATLLERFNAGLDAQLARTGLLEAGGRSAVHHPTPRSSPDARTTLADKDGPR